MTLKTKRDEEPVLIAFASKILSAEQLEGTDVRDLVVRIQSNDVRTSRIARKKLLNIVHGETKKH